MNAPEPGDSPPRRRFLDHLRAALDSGAFSRLRLSDPLPPAPVAHLEVRPLTLRGEASVQIVERVGPRERAQNLRPAEALTALAPRIGSEFRHAHLLTPTRDLQLRPRRRGGWRLQEGLVTAPSPLDAPPPGHDRPKRRHLDPRLPFLHPLGVTDAKGRVLPSMSRKWRQMDKFVEILDDAWQRSELAARPRLRLLDFGAGKGYLTFAAEDHLRRTRGVAARVTGLDLRADLVESGNALARRLGLADLDFQVGGLDSVPAEPLDILVALHACDTATDLALERGVRGGAAILLCSPCCHRELRPRLRPPPVLEPLLRHGIHREAEAEMLTDALRALFLEASGYQARVFEFISPEHTGKNRMILAVRRHDGGDPAAARRQALDLLAFYGLPGQALGERLGLLPPAPPSGEPGPPPLRQ
jgi:SAM-dependent methyltransferase